MSILYTLQEELDDDIATASSKFRYEDEYSNLRNDLDKFLNRGNWYDQGHKVSKGKKTEDGPANTRSKSVEIVLSQHQPILGLGGIVEASHHFQQNSPSP